MFVKKNIFYRTLELLSSDQRAKGLVVIFLLMVGSLLDFFSLATFFPLILLVVNPGLIEDFPLLQDAYHFFGFTNSSSLGISLTLLVLIFTLLKTRINQWIAFRKASYAYGIGNDMATSAIERYFKLPYQEFTNIDFAKELNQLSNIPLIFANNIIIPAGTLISEILVLLILCFTIAMYQVKVFSLLFLILVPAYFIYRLNRKHASAISTSIGIAYPKLLKYTLQIVEGLIDIRSFQKESFFKKRFDETNKEVGQIFSLDHASQTDTARATELVAVFCLCLMLLYSLISQQNQQETLLLLGVYAGVGLRIVPSINRIFSALHQIRINNHVINELPDIIGLADDDLGNQVQATTFNSTIHINKISFSYPAGSQILQKTTMVIKKGEKIAITGVSGTGKTTLFLILLGLLDVLEGKILLDGKSVNKMVWRKLFGYVPQQPYILDASIAENIAFGIPGKEINREKINAILTQMELSEWVNSLPDGIDTTVGEKGLKMSGGQRQRLAIARGLYHDPEILLLDEVTNQLDPHTEAEIVETLEKAASGKTIIMIAHRPDLFKHFDHVYELIDGTVREMALNALSPAS